MYKEICLLCSIMLSLVKISQAQTVELPAYQDKDSGLVCNPIILSDDFLKIIDRTDFDDNEYNNAFMQTACKKELQSIMDSIASAKTDIDLINIAGTVSGLLCFFVDEDRNFLEDIFLNLEMRAALMGNPTAMEEILCTTIPIRDASTRKNFTLHGQPMTREQFSSIPNKINEKYEEISKINLLSETLSEL